MTNLISLPASTGNWAPPAIALWLGCLAFIVVLANGLLRLADRMREKPASKREIYPQPLEVSGELETRSKGRRFSSALCDKTHEALDARVTKLEDGRETDTEAIKAVSAEMVEMERRLNKADEDRTTGLHLRLNEILAEVSETRGQMKKTNP